METMYLWFAVAVFLFIFEILTPGVFFFACLGVGAAVAGISFWLSGSNILSLVVFVVVSLASIYFVKPALKKYLKAHKKMSNIDGLIGRKTLVVEKITPTQMGFVKIDGELWKALSGEEIDVGSTVEVLKVEGTHLVVKGLNDE